MMAQFTDAYIYGLMEDCSISIDNALEILQSSIKPSICVTLTWWVKHLGDSTEYVLSVHFDTILST